MENEEHFKISRDALAPIVWEKDIWTEFGRIRS